MSDMQPHQDLVELVSRRLRELGSPGRPMSYRAAADRAAARGTRINHETLRKIALGRHTGQLTDGSVAGLAAALGVSRAQVLRAMHETRPASVAWKPPPAASRLSHKQRTALDQLILAMVEDPTKIDDQEVVGVLSTSDDVDAMIRSDGELIVRSESGFGTTRTITADPLLATKAQLEAATAGLSALLDQLTRDERKASQ